MTFKLETETFTRCVGCRKRIQVISPPLKKQYEAGMIQIRGGSLLLPESVVEMNSKPGISAPHSAGLEGYYCNRECLSARINELLCVNV